MNGRTYATGDRVPMEKVPSDLAKKLIAQRRVEPASARVTGTRKER